MFDEAGGVVEDREQARQFGVERENGSFAILRLHPESHIEKVERH
jgi:hypothetical protein